MTRMFHKEPNICGMIVTSALVIWKTLMCITGTEAPVVVVLSGSMEPGFKRGDILFLHMSKAPIRAGDIVVFNVEGKDISIVHRVIKVHEQEGAKDVYYLTKGDDNDEDDYEGGIYADDQKWLRQQDVAGRIVGFLPYIGWATILMSEKPIIKSAPSVFKMHAFVLYHFPGVLDLYMLIGALGLLVITSKE
ncbi:uncharacterized protein LOC131065061 isoform X2 [Cryptomeria japonica]|uniref:uncharacterized protein LOC131065061 isoform X2 n=1 Tax=Cryptomeria japonica TaxID=3369 RepID=UPI0027D9E7BA|nr:uncharacterized protein LOC131065061 isoform X2 [Cryptomeria japonica]XP_057855440.2 uncharacterized protein LOC131065061 isoform X2 [Cryptomeria japonica]